MKTKELKLDFIEVGRMSDGEMMEICGGASSCGTKSPDKCIEYYQCTDMKDPNKRNYCATKTFFADPIDVSLTIDPIYGYDPIRP